MSKKKPAVAPAAKPAFDLALVPGTKAEQQAAANRMLRHRQKPIEIAKASGGYVVKVLGTSIGVAPTKDLACSIAFSVGRYRLDLGDFVDTYIDGYGCTTRGKK